MLLSVLRSPRHLAHLRPHAAEAVIAQALASTLTPTLAAKAEELGLGGLPRALDRQFQAARVLVGHNRRQLAWEVDRIALALRSVPGSIILLKGAAYSLRDLPLAEGRYASDVDILVPKERIAEVEAALRDAGWDSVKQNPYDEAYYRQWMHEIPPLKNRERGTFVDVHHTILPETGRLSPDVQRLFAHAEPLGDGKLATLSPQDMVLHAVVHWIQDGDLDRRLRDLVDIHAMLTDFAQRPGFWPALLEAAAAHGFERPLFYAFHFAREMMGTDIPQDVWKEAAKGRPPAPVMGMMRRLVPPAVTPDPLDGAGFGQRLARLLMLMRAHWLRMPPWILVKHLTRKALMRFRGQA